MLGVVNESLSGDNTLFSCCTWLQPWAGTLVVLVAGTAGGDVNSISRNDWWEFQVICSLSAGISDSLPSFFFVCNGFFCGQRGAVSSKEVEKN